MTESSDHFEREFAPHSRHKHLIFKNYLESWLRKLSLGARGQDRLFIVDACAGTGSDAVGNPGSPLIAAYAARDAIEQLRREFGREVQTEVIAIEKDRHHLAKLKRALSDFPNARALDGTLEEHLSAIEGEIGDAPALYFIDPFGISPLSANLILSVLSRPRHEVFLLFADQAALRHFGAVQAGESKATRRLRQFERRAQPFFPGLEEAARAPLAAKAERGERALDTTKQSAIRILDAAFGGNSWLPRVNAVPPSERRRVFLELYRELLREQAKWVLEIPMLNEEGGRVYSLLHATRNASGFTTMKEAVAYALRHSPHPPDVVTGLMSALTIDLDPVVALVLGRFGGQTVPWADSASEDNAQSVKRTVLESTQVHHFQLEELKARLTQYRLPGRAIKYAFP